MEDKIKHEGIVEKIEDGCISVKIVQSSACAHCHLAGQCHSSEQKKKVINVYHHKGSLSVGDRVKVCASLGLGWLAIVYAFAIPLAIIIAVLFIMTSFDTSEAHAAIVCLASLVPYYLVLYLFRGKLAKRLMFTIEK